MDKTAFLKLERTNGKITAALTYPVELQRGSTLESDEEELQRQFVKLDVLLDGLIYGLDNPEEGEETVDEETGEIEETIEDTQADDEDKEAPIEKKESPAARKRAKKVTKKMVESFFDAWTLKLEDAHPKELEGVSDEEYGDFMTTKMEEFLEGSIDEVTTKMPLDEFEALKAQALA